MSGMIVYPAIDLYGGKVVRLRKGEFDAKTVYGDDPLDTAKGFFDAGSEYLHIVDLEAAETGEPKHLETLTRIADALDMFIHFGGGLRGEDSIRSALDAGADRAMIGSILFRSKDSPAELFDRFGDAILPSVDVKSGSVAISGWKESTGSSPVSVIEGLVTIGYKHFLVTSADRDGTLAGPDIELYRSIAHTGAQVIAAGGISSEEDVIALARSGARGAVLGRSLYEGRADLKSVIDSVSKLDKKER